MKVKIISTIIMFSAGIFLLSTLESWMHKPHNAKDAMIEQSASKAFLLLQKSGYIFTNNNKFKCASCHHNTLTAMAAGIARQKGVPVIDSFTANRVASMENMVIAVCNPNLINQFLPISFAVPYILLGLDAEKYPANMHTDVSVDFMMGQARPDGSFLAESGRAPLETGDIHLTSLAIRSIQLYASAAKKQHVNELVARTRQWL